MSRWFPYPPPGYEPRIKSDRKDLLKKERHKGKKHKKENGREKGDRKGKDGGKAERKGKGRDHKEIRREKRRQKRKNKDRDNDNHQSSGQKTQKIDYFDNRRPEGRRKHEAVEDTKLSVQGGHPNHKVNSTSELLHPSSKGLVTVASKENERSFSRMDKKSGHATQHQDLVQHNNSTSYAKKKETDAGVNSQTIIKNGKNVQVGSGGEHSSKRHSSKMKQMVSFCDINEQNKVNDLVHLAGLDGQKFACNDIKKRK